MSSGTRVLYTARVHARGGREHGLARSSDGLLDIRLSRPGTARIGTNPEQLLAAGWSACFGSSLETAARKRGLALPANTSVEAEISLKLADDDHFLSARLRVKLDGFDAEIAKALLNEARRICPFSKAIGDKIDVAITMRSAKDLLWNPEAKI